MSNPVPHDPHDTSALSAELRSLVAAADAQPMTVGQILHHMRDRGYLMFVVVVTLPFLLLPTTFGLSAPMGLAIALIGFCIALGREPWLPAFILRKSFPYEALVRMSERAAGVSRRVERVARPRLAFMLWPGPRHLAGLNLALWSLLMAVPGPNNVFAFMMLLIAFGLLMRDGLLLLAAHVLTLLIPLLLWLFWNAISPYVMPYVTELWQKVSGLFA